MELWAVNLLIVLSLILGLIFGRMVGYGRGYRDALRKHHESERKQRQDDKELSGRENIANRLANVVTKSDLAKHYEVERSQHHMNIAEFVEFVRRSDKVVIASVEVNLHRRPNYHVIIHASNGQGWHFGSDNKSLDEATDHLTIGLQNQAA